MENSPYTPLDSASSEIRLLVLLPATNIRAPIICTLEKVCLHSYPQYEALSYTWGSPGRTHDISLDGIPFTVWENAEAALRRLRYIDRCRRLWIDAICINQADDKEKAHQLLLMELIYPRAENVCVWLGESTELSGIGMAKAQMTKKIGARAIQWGENILPGCHNVDNLKMAPTERASHIYELEWGEVRELLARPWWSRAWIIQEAVLAKNLVIMCGPDTATWETIEKALKKQPKDVSAFRMFGIKLDPDDSMVEDTFQTISHFRKERAHNRWNTSIYELLYEFRKQDCTNHRDRIYSFLGLAKDLNGVTVVPRYEKSISTAEIYADFARQMIRSTGSLEILNCAPEWRNISSPQKQAFAYSIFNQSSYHDTHALVTYDDSNKVMFGWAALPQGWQRVKRGRSCVYYDWNTNTEHVDSPLLSLPPRQALWTKARRKCPPGWTRSHDNLGRVQVKYEPTSPCPCPTSAVTHEDGELTSLPSWAPNWAGITHIDPTPLLDWSLPTPAYRASGSTSVEPDYLGAAGDSLSLNRFTFDKISQTAQPWHPSPNTITVSRRGIVLLEEWESLALQPHLNCPYGGPEGRKEALWRTHIADAAGAAATPSKQSSFVECWHDHGGWKPLKPTPDELAAISSNWKLGAALVNARSTAKWTTEITELMAKADKTYNPLKIVKEAVKFGVHGQKEYGVFLKRIHRACAHRRLFVTKKGYMGLAPWNAEVGDSVVILFGGQTPFLLRPEPVGCDRWKLVGETFVYGIMGGEAMAGSPMLQRFHIC